VDAVKTARWASRLLGLAMLVVLLLVLKAVQAQFEKLASEQAGQGAGSEGASPTDAGSREGDVPADAAW
jgi:hypothetical protein